METKNKNKNKNKKGISLIVLIITIIVVIILAAAVILTISKNNPVNSAKEAAFKSDIRNFQDSLAMYVGKQLVTDYYGNREKITVIDNLDDMDKYISGYNKKKYSDKLGIEDDELVYFPDKVTKDEKKWLDDLGIKPYSVYIPEAGEDCFIWNGNAITGYYDEKLKEFLSTTNGVLKIPKRCTGISYISFENVSYIENVITQDGLLNISSKSFRGCANLKSVYISQSVRYISDEWVFNGCSNLVSIEVDSENECYSSQDGVLYNKEKTTLIAAPGKIEECNVPSTVKTIGKNAFYLCKNLKKVILLDGLESIGARAFEHCTSLSEVKLPNTLKKVDIDAFSSANITGELVIPDSVESIENSSFSNCTNISKVIIGNSLKTISGISSISYSTFDRCSNLKEFEVKSGNNYFSSKDGILYNKDKTKLILAPSACEVNDLYIPNSVKEIGDYSFYGSTNVKGKIYLPEGLISIGSQSFSQCGISGEVNIPSSVTRIKSSSFFNAEYVTKINVNSNNLNYSSQDGILYNKDKTELIIAPKGLTINNLTLPDSLKVIDSLAFDGCKGITGTLTLGENLETIKERAFEGCSGINKIVLNNNLKVIENQAFNCFNASGTVIIPESVISIKYWAFYGCNKLESIKCRASSKPDGWDDDWNKYCNANVEWGYTGD